MSKRTTKKRRVDALQNKRIKQLRKDVSALTKVKARQYIDHDDFNTMGAGGLVSGDGGFNGVGHSYSLLYSIPSWQPGVVYAPQTVEQQKRFGSKCLIKSIRFRGSLQVPFDKTSIMLYHNRPVTRVRLVLVHMIDLGSNSTVMTDNDSGISVGGLHWDDVFRSNDIDSQYATRSDQEDDSTPVHQGRPTYKVLKDKTYDVCPEFGVPDMRTDSGSVFTSYPNTNGAKATHPFFINLKWKDGLMTEWKLGSEQNDAPIKNDIYLLAISDTIVGPTPATGSVQRLAYVKASGRIRFQDSI